VSDPNSPVELPADLPPEYAEAYRRGYERAVAAAGGTDGDDEQPPDTADQAAFRRPSEPVLPRSDSGLDAETASTSVIPVAPEVAEEPFESAVSAADYDYLFRDPVRADVDWSADPTHRFVGPVERPAWLVPAILAVLALLLLGTAYGVGRLVSSQMRSSATHQPTGAVVTGSSTPSPSSSTTSTALPSGRVYRGAVVAASPTGASASCQAPNGVDAAGRKIRYVPANVFDQDTSTAWRCNGNGVGDKLVLTLAGRVRIGEVGLIPGYAKTDPASGVDRYRQNDRITAVRWTFSDGHSIVQHLDGSPTNRSMQTVRIPVMRTGRITITILSSVLGPRNTVAISEVTLGQLP